VDEAVLASPFETYERLRSAGPVHYEPSLDLFFVLDHGVIRAVLDDPTTFSSNLVAVMQRDAYGVNLPASEATDGVDVLAIADPPAHTEHRKLFQPTFGKREVESLRPMLDGEVTRRVRDLVAAGSGDWMEVVALPVPVWVISRILGLPDSDADRLVRWSDAAVELLSGLTDADRMEVLIGELHHFLAYLSSELNTATGGVIGDLRGAVGGGRLTADEAVNMLVQLVTAGTESTTSLMGAAVRTLALDGAMQSQMRRSPGLIETFIEETLRLESPFRGHFRLATVDSTLGGVSIPAGGRLMLLWGAANRDPRQYGNPDRLDLARPAVKNHLAFGRGIHFCLGAHLARLEAQVALRRLLELTEAFELSVDHVDRYRPSLLVRRLDHVVISTRASL
jgi:cytochrome P450